MYQTFCCLDICNRLPILITDIFMFYSYYSHNCLILDLQAGFCPFSRDFQARNPWRIRPFQDLRFRISWFAKSAVPAPLFKIVSDTFISCHHPACSVVRKVTQIRIPSEIPSKQLSVLDCADSSACDNMTAKTKPWLTAWESRLTCADWIRMPNFRAEFHVTLSAREQGKDL